MTQIFAHRGFSSTAPENTLAAMRAAQDLRVDGIELDIQMSKDGHIVVIHDEDVRRTTNGHGLVKDLLLAELRQLDAGSWFAPEFAGERIPLLSEVFEMFCDQQMILNIEIKTGLVEYPGIEGKLLALVSEYGYEERVVISSFNHHSLCRVRELNDAIELGILYTEGLVDPWLYANYLQAQALHPYHRVIVPSLLLGCKEHEIAVRAWTVDSPIDQLRLLHAGVDSIITNKPDQLFDLRKNLNEAEVNLFDVEPVSKLR